MPIAPDKRHLYPPNWQQISFRIRFVRAEGRCEWCGVEHKAVGHRDENGEFHPVSTSTNLSDESLRLITIILTTAHLNHDPTDNRETNLAALCQRCHLNHDREHHAKSRARNARRNAIKRGQGTLFDGYM